MSETAAIQAVVLDAMGVIYRAGEDVHDLLVPFCRARGGETDERHVAAAYREASLGRISADAFWARVGLDASAEFDYLAQHELTPGLFEFLADMRDRGVAVWCLSNDVARWSHALRRTFRLEPWFRGFVVSGEIGARKPDRTAYEALIAVMTIEPARALFVDDRQANVDAAAAVGFAARRFEAGGADSATGGVASFAALATLVAARSGG